MGRTSKEYKRVWQSTRYKTDPKYRKKVLAQSKAWRESPRGRAWSSRYHRDYMLRQRYNITQGDFLTLKKKQKYLCRICRKRRKLVVDHNHRTNRVRGLLCLTCNAALGWYERYSKGIFSHVK